MKKVIAIIALITLTLGITAFALVSCGVNLNYVYKNEINLAADVTFIKPNGKTKSADTLKSSDGDYIVIDLKEVKTFNTIVLKEYGSAIKRFSIHTSVDSDYKKPEYKHIYSSDKIESIKTCFVEEQQARFIRISVAEASSSYNINSIEVFNIAKSDKDFRVTAYLRPDLMSTNLADFDADKLKACTDIIFFGTAALTGSGDIVFANEQDEIDYGIKLQILKDAMANVGRENINIILDLSLPYGNDNAQIYSMLKDNKDKTIANIKAFVEKYDFDGYDIDFEYPYKSREHNAYNDFLVSVKKAMPDKILSIASQSWAFKFSAEARNAIDRIELMCYDMFDADGHHSAFASSFEEVQKAINYGFAPEKIDIGVPFYSRPLNKLAHWDSYFNVVDMLGRYENIDYTPTVDHDGLPLVSPRYFNSYQMIMDKTAYAYDMGIGGMMIWHYESDAQFSHELSLFRAIYNTLEMKRN